MNFEAAWPPERGNRVTHFKNPDRVGTVMKVVQDPRSDEYIVYVGYTTDGPWIPYYYGLSIIDSSAEMNSPRPRTSREP